MSFGKVLEKNNFEKIKYRPRTENLGSPSTTFKHKEKNVTADVTNFYFLDVNRVVADGKIIEDCEYGNYKTHYSDPKEEQQEVFDAFEKRIKEIIKNAK